MPPTIQPSFRTIVMSQAAASTPRSRVLSGMRPTGALHLGHYHGALKNWVRLQAQYDCFYFVADWHALTTHYANREVIERNVYEMVIDWLAAGVDPEIGLTPAIQSVKDGAVGGAPAVAAGQGHHRVSRWG